MWEKNLAYHCLGGDRHSLKSTVVAILKVGKDKEGSLFYLIGLQQGVVKHLWFVGVG